jgi:hypothetical protein
MAHGSSTPNILGSDKMDFSSGASLHSLSDQIPPVDLRLRRTVARTGSLLSPGLPGLLSGSSFSLFVLVLLFI